MEPNEQRFGMKVAISVNHPRIEAPLERRFGRCNYFLIIDTKTRAWESLLNPAVEAMGGAGTQAAQFLADHGIEAIVSGDFGPKARAALHAAGIRMFSSQGGRADALLEDFLADRLTQVSSHTSPHKGGTSARGKSR
jgi:predicted Fe-Mo cluster-binding NifX family protein